MRSARASSKNSKLSFCHPWLLVAESFCWENILSPSDNHGINQTDVLKKKKICKNINPYIFAQLVFTAKHSTASLPYSKYARYEIYICCNHHPSSPTLQTKWRVCQFNKFISKLWKYLINLTCWQAGCDSMLRVGRGQGWLPNATLSGKLRGREGRRRRWGYDTDISPKQGERCGGGKQEGRRRGEGWEPSPISGHFWPLLSGANRHNYPVRKA